MTKITSFALISYLMLPSDLRTPTNNFLVRRSGQNTAFMPLDVATTAIYRK